MVQWQLPFLLWALWIGIGWAIAQPIAQPSPSMHHDIRTQTAYYDADRKHLKMKAQTYFDFWAEREVKHGRYSRWRRNGSLKYEAWYTDGKIHGTAIWYNRQEEPVKKVLFDQGKPVPQAKPSHRRKPIPEPEKPASKPAQPQKSKQERPRIPFFHKKPPEPASTPTP